MFKSFKYIDEALKVLNEADEVTEENDATKETEGSENVEETPTEEQPQDEVDATSDPSQVANPDQGQFVSDLGDAEYASIMIRALASNPAFKDKIPQEFLNAQTTENAQQIIQFVKNMVGLQNSGGDTGFNNMTDEEVLNMSA